MRWAGWFVAMGVALATSFGACGGGGGGDFADLNIAVFTINGPFAAGAEEPFVLRGDFSHLSGAGVEILFVVEEGEPFPAGISSVDKERSNVGPDALAMP